MRAGRKPTSFITVCPESRRGTEISVFVENTYVICAYLCVHISAYHSYFSEVCVNCYVLTPSVCVHVFVWVIDTGPWSPISSYSGPQKASEYPSLISFLRLLGPWNLALCFWLTPACWDRKKHVCRAQPPGLRQRGSSSQHCPVGFLQQWKHLKCPLSNMAATN